MFVGVFEGFWLCVLAVLGVFDCFFGGLCLVVSFSPSSAILSACDSSISAMGSIASSLAILDSSPPIPPPRPGVVGAVARSMGAEVGEVSEMGSTSSMSFWSFSRVALWTCMRWFSSMALSGNFSWHKGQAIMRDTEEAGGGGAAFCVLLLATVMAAGLTAC